MPTWRIQLRGQRAEGNCPECAPDFNPMRTRTAYLFQKREPGLPALLLIA